MFKRKHRPVVLGLLLLICMASLLLASGCKKKAPAEEVAPVEGEEGAPTEDDGLSADDAAPAEPGSPVCARVNGEAVITQAELQAALESIVERYERVPGRSETTPSWRNLRRRRIVQNAVHDHLVQTYVNAQNITVTDEQVEEHLRNELGHVFENESLFARYLDSQQKDRDTFMEEKRQQIATRQVLSGRGDLEPTPEQIDTFYQQNRERWREGERARVSTLTIRMRPGTDDATAAAKREELEALVTRVNRGEDFAAVAIDASEGPEASRGGDMGWVVRGLRRQLAADGAEDVIFETREGRMTEPVRTSLGWQVFLVHSKRPEGVRELDEVSDIILAPLRRRQEEQLKVGLVNELRTGAEIEYIEAAWGLEDESEEAEE